MNGKGLSINETLKGLYAIADSGSSAPEALPGFVKKLLDGGCRLVQLRMKGIGNREPGTGNRMVRDAAVEIMKLKGGYDFTFIVNDHVDIAMEVGADGVHVGENDEPARSIKARAPGLIVGYSSHSIEEAAWAVRDGADYVAFGAIYPTKVKGPGHPVQGVDKLRRLLHSVSAPVVAIGGIGRENIDEVLAAGPASVAMIGALSRAPDVAAETAWFLSKLRAASDRGMNTEY